MALLEIEITLIFHLRAYSLWHKTGKDEIPFPLLLVLHILEVLLLLVTKDIELFAMRFYSK